MTAALSRRKLLAGAALGTLALAYLGVTRARNILHHRASARRFLAILGGRDVLAPLGRRFLAAAEDGPALSDLVAALETRLGFTAETADDGLLRQRLAAIAREDFDRGLTLETSGWVLSRTGAQVAMLAALI